MNMWIPGPWSDEPDSGWWVDETTGLDCLTLRHPRLGHWSGYVTVPSGHPWHGADTTDLPSEEIDVHGGISYSRPGDTTIGLSADRPDGLWWVGFDCAHARDLTPAEASVDENELRSDWGIYRPLAFVRRECARLAEQISEAHR